ncbi:hypothetical protein Acsp02_45750 [Actinoplanes sp. NBRC 103695]|nr:hypothetical protein Acsp02_45750 [Actinoplanes sp. NBRC 103695]
MHLLQSDLHSLGAAAYFCLVGEATPSDLDEARRLLKARIKNLRVRRGHRLAGHLALMLSADPVARPNPVGWADQAIAHVTRLRRRTRLAVAAAVAAVLALAGGGLDGHSVPCGPSRRGMLAPVLSNLIKTLFLIRLRWSSTRWRTRIGFCVCGPGPRRG